MTSATPNTIEREIEIDAPAERVWSLVSEPGWWINNGEIVENTIEHTGHEVIVSNVKHGTFRLTVNKLDEPRYASFGWLSGPEGGADTSTTVEFWITDRDGGVVLKVVESGFAGQPEGQGATNHARNSEGWEIELAAARAFCAAGDSRRARD